MWMPTAWVPRVAFRVQRFEDIGSEAKTNIPAQEGIHGPGSWASPLARRPHHHTRHSGESRNPADPLNDRALSNLPLPHIPKPITPHPHDTLTLTLPSTFVLYCLC